jgi:hypothetical protein
MAQGGVLREAVNCIYESGLKNAMLGLIKQVGDTLSRLTRAYRSCSMDQPIRASP